MASTRPILPRLLTSRALASPLRSTRGFASAPHGHHTTSSVSSGQLAAMSAGATLLVGAGIYQANTTELGAIGKGFQRRDARNAQILEAVRAEAPTVGPAHDITWPRR